MPHDIIDKPTVVKGLLGAIRQQAIKMLMKTDDDKGDH